MLRNWAFVQFALQKLTLTKTARHLQNVSSGAVITLHLRLCFRLIRCA